MVAFDATYGSPIQQAVINFTGSGDQIVVAGISGQVIRVLQFFIVLGASATLIYKSGATALTGPLSFLANGAQVQDFIQCPLNCLSPGDPFIINANNAVTVGGTIWYVQSPSLS
jgi:hypothetical protein